MSISYINNTAANILLTAGHKERAQKTGETIKDIERKQILGDQINGNQIKVAERSKRIRLNRNIHKKRGKKVKAIKNSKR